MGRRDDDDDGVRFARENRVMRVLFGHLGGLNICTVCKSKAWFILRVVEIAMYGALCCYNIVEVNGRLHDAFRAPKRRSRRA